MKKIYIQPSIKEVMLMQETQLMAGSGPVADEQVNPGVGGGGGSRSYQGFDDDEDYY
jgi:hypothetical protein